MPFGVKRLLYSGRRAKAEAAEVNGEFGKIMEGNTHSGWGIIKSSSSKGQIDNVIKLSNKYKRKIRYLSVTPLLPLKQFPWTHSCLRATSSSFPVPCRQKPRGCVTRPSSAR